MHFEMNVLAAMWRIDSGRRTGRLVTAYCSRLRDILVDYTMEMSAERERREKNLPGLDH